MSIVSSNAAPPNAGLPAGARTFETFSLQHREKLAMGSNAPAAAPATDRKKKSKARITVVVRKRPLSAVEGSRHETDILKTKRSDKASIYVNEPRKNVCGVPYTETHHFTFDRAYNESNSNLDVYKSCVRPLVDAVFQQGARCSCFAYGQTGSGKTYTMVGPAKLKQQMLPPEKQGLLELAARDSFAWLRRPEFDYNYGLYVSFFEIYCNKVYDLLNGRRLVKALETNTGEGVVVKDLTSVKVTDLPSILAVFSVGFDQRVVGSNSKNADSSRGHGILTLDVRNEYAQSTFGRLAFIDLAGSERGADAMYSGKQTQQDGAGINRSLLALKECIRALDQQSTHVPFRDSELTKVLRDMFLGNKARTVMISCVSPASGCCEQSLNTLRYADRVKAIRRNCKPDIVEDDDDDEGGEEDEEEENTRGVDGGAVLRDRLGKDGDDSKSDEGGSSVYLSNEEGEREDGKLKGSSVSLGSSHFSDYDRNNSDVSAGVPASLESEVSSPHPFLSSNPQESSRRRLDTNGRLPSSSNLSKVAQTGDRSTAGQTQPDGSYLSPRVERWTKNAADRAAPKKTDGATLGGQRRGSRRGEDLGIGASATDASGEAREGASRGPVVSGQRLVQKIKGSSTLQHHGSNQVGADHERGRLGPQQPSERQRQPSPGAQSRYTSGPHQLGAAVPEISNLSASMFSRSSQMSASGGQSQQQQGPRTSRHPVSRGKGLEGLASLREARMSGLASSCSTPGRTSTKHPQGSGGRPTESGDASGSPALIEAEYKKVQSRRVKAAAGRHGDDDDGDGTLIVSDSRSAGGGALQYSERKAREVLEDYPAPIDEDDMAYDDRLLALKHQDSSHDDQSNTRSAREATRPDVSDVFPPREADDLRAAASLLRRKYRDWNFPLVPEGASDSSKSVPLETATKMLRGLNELSPEEVEGFHQFVSGRLNRSYGELVAYHIDCLRGQTYLGLTQQRMLKTACSTSQISPQYIQLLRRTIEAEIGLYLKLGKKLVELERIASLHTVVGQTFEQHDGDRSTRVNGEGWNIGLESSKSQNAAESGTKGGQVSHSRYHESAGSSSLEIEARRTDYRRDISSSDGGGAIAMTTNSTTTATTTTSSSTRGSTSNSKSSAMAITQGSNYNTRSSDMRVSAATTVGVTQNTLRTIRENLPMTTASPNTSTSVHSASQGIATVENAVFTSRRSTLSSVSGDRPTSGLDRPLKPPVATTLDIDRGSARDSGPLGTSVLKNAPWHGLLDLKHTGVVPATISKLMAQQQLQDSGLLIQPQVIKKTRRTRKSKVAEIEST